MRKLLFIVIAFVACTTASNAQTSFGVKAGANFANLKASTSGFSLSFENKIGAHGGFFLTAPLSSNFSIQPEAVLSMEGAKSDGEKINLTYLNIPLMFQYNASGFIAETGPQVGFLMSAKSEGEDIKEDMETINFSWGIGAGYRLVNGLGFNARYNLGLSNIAKTEAGDEGTLKSNVIQVGLTFQFGRGSVSN